MRALTIAQTAGPEGLRLTDLPDPPGRDFMGGEGVVIDVRAAAVSFPDVLQSRGLYQFRPDLPFTPGAEVAGVVRSAPADSGFRPGERVAAMTVFNGMAEVAVAPEHLTFVLPDELDFAQGAALVMIYHTVYFALKLGGRLQPGEAVLVHGAAGGVGTAGLQVAKGLGATTIAVVSGDEKAEVAREAGADEVVLEVAA